MSSSACLSHRKDAEHFKRLRSLYAKQYAGRPSNYSFIQCISLMLWNNFLIKKQDKGREVVVPPFYSNHASVVVQMFIRLVSLLSCMSMITRWLFRPSRSYFPWRWQKIEHRYINHKHKHTGEVLREGRQMIHFEYTV